MCMACSSAPMTAARFSRAAFSDPGRLRIRLLPRVPATARESMGKEHLYVWEMTPGMVQENDAAARLLALCGQENMTRTEVKEGKIELKAACDGVFLVDSARLVAVNSQDEVMIATRKGGTAVHAGDKLAGMRVIPLIIEEEKLRRAEQAAGRDGLRSDAAQNRGGCTRHARRHRRAG